MAIHPTSVPPWLEPLPDGLLDEQHAGSKARYDVARSIELAFVIALQQLRPLDRAVLVLRDVVGFRLVEVAEMLGIDLSEAGNALQRARADLDARLCAPGRHSSSSDCHVLAERFAGALEQGDVGRLAALLTDNARLAMPPEPGEQRGAARVAVVLAAYYARRGLRLLSAKANGQPAFGCYVRDHHRPVARAEGLIVLTVDGDLISAVTRFAGTAHHRSFDLPATMPAD